MTSLRTILKKTRTSILAVVSLTANLHAQDTETTTLTVGNAADGTLTVVSGTLPVIAPNDRVTIRVTGTLREIPIRRATCQWRWQETKKRGKKKIITTYTRDVERTVFGELGSEITMLISVAGENPMVGGSGSLIAPTASGPSTGPFPAVRGGPLQITGAVTRSQPDTSRPREIPPSAGERPGSVFNRIEEPIRFRVTVEIERS